MLSRRAIHLGGAAMRCARAARRSASLFCGCAAALLLAACETDVVCDAGADCDAAGPDGPEARAASALESEVPPAAPDCALVVAGEGLCATPLPLFSTGRLTVLLVELSATEAPLEALIGLSYGKDIGVHDLAAVVRLAPSGVLEALDGTAYRSDETFAYHAGHTYQLYLVADLASHTYSVFAWEWAFAPVAVARPEQRERLDHGLAPAPAALPSW